MPDTKGNVAVSFNSERMFRGWNTEDGKVPRCLPREAAEVTSRHPHPVEAPESALPCSLAHSLQPILSAAEPPRLIPPAFGRQQAGSRRRRTQKVRSPMRSAVSRNAQRAPGPQVWGIEGRSCVWFGPGLSQGGPGSGPCY